MAQRPWMPASCAAVVVACVLTGAPAALAAEGATVTVVRSTPETARVTFDLAGMPGNAVLVVERRLGPKGAFVEMARTALDTGVVSIDLTSSLRVVVRTTVVGTRGVVLLRTETRL